MIRRDTLYLLSCTLAPVMTCLALVSFAFSQFFTAWLSALVVAFSMELRVQAGERLPRTGAFWTHLCSATIAFLALTALAFLARPLWLVALAAATGLVAFWTGAALWYRGLRARMLHLKR